MVGDSKGCRPTGAGEAMVRRLYVNPVKHRATVLRRPMVTE
jgi:hypothetical protein